MFTSINLSNKQVCGMWLFGSCVFGIRLVLVYGFKRSEAKQKEEKQRKKHPNFFVQGTIVLFWSILISGHCPSLNSPCPSPFCYRCLVFTSINLSNKQVCGMWLLGSCVFGIRLVRVCLVYGYLARVFLIYGLVYGLLLLVYGLCFGIRLVFGIRWYCAFQSASIIIEWSSVDS